jgi:hypothetical protein
LGENSHGYINSNGYLWSISYQKRFLPPKYFSKLNSTLFFSNKTKIPVGDLRTGNFSVHWFLPWPEYCYFLLKYSNDDEFVSDLLPYIIKQQPFLQNNDTVIVENPKYKGILNIYNSL